VLVVALLFGAASTGLALSSARESSIQSEPGPQARPRRRGPGELFGCTAVGSHDRRFQAARQAVR